MGRWGKILGGVFKALSLLLIGLAAFLLAVFIWPRILINPVTARWAAAYLKQRGTYLDWRALELTARSTTFLNKEITLRSRDLCFHQVDNGLRVCAQNSEARVAIKFEGLHVTLTEVGPLAVNGAGLVWKELIVPGVDKTKVPEVKPADTSVIPENLMIFSAPAWLRAAELHKIEIELSHVDYDQAGKRWAGTAKILGSPEGKGSRWKLDAHAVGGEKKDVHAAKGEFDFVSRDTRWEGPWAGNVNLSVTTNKTVVSSVEGRLFQTEIPHHYGVNLKVKYTEKKMVVKTELTANFDRTRLRSVLNGEVKNPAEKLARVSWKKCAIDSRLDRVEAAIDCPIKFQVRLPKDAEGLYHRLTEDLEAKLGVEVKGRPPTATQKSPVTVALTLAIEPLLTTIKEGKGAIRVEADGDLKNFPKGWKVQSQASANIQKFEKVVAMLAYSPYAIPEPISSLSGQLELDVTAIGELPPLNFKFPIVFKSRLHSPTQVIAIDGNGEWDLAPENEGQRNKFKVKVVLQDVRLVLPHLNLEAPPRLYPDSRIKVGQAASTREVATKKKGSKIDYEIEIETVANHPLHLSSNLAKKDIPVDLHLRMTPDQTHGTVKVVKFPLDLFHRTATVDYFNLKMGNKINASEIQGQITVDYSDYKVSILISGLANKPVFRFISDPPLAEDQVIAILLFGKPMNNLTGQNIQNVGQARAAAASSAISLASMYLLASTPVESIGYDPSTNVFTAKINLADGTTLSIGDDLENPNQGSIGLKEYLGSRWWINSTVNSAFDPTKRKVESFLEWSNMY